VIAHAYWGYSVQRVSAPHCRGKVPHTEYIPNMEYRYIGEVRCDNINELPRTGTFLVVIFKLSIIFFKGRKLYISNKLVKNSKLCITSQTYSINCTHLVAYCSTFKIKSFHKQMLTFYKKQTTFHI
jgi:hypothetical protein